MYENIFNFNLVSYLHFRLMLLWGRCAWTTKSFLLGHQSSWESFKGRWNNGTGIKALGAAFSSPSSSVSWACWLSRRLSQIRLAVPRFSGIPSSFPLFPDSGIPVISASFLALHLAHLFDPPLHLLALHDEVPGDARRAQSVAPHQLRAPLQAH